MESGAKQLSDRSGVLKSGASGQMRELEDRQQGEGWMVELSSGNWKTDNGAGGNGKQKMDDRDGSPQMEWGWVEDRKMELQVR